MRYWQRHEGERTVVTDSETERDKQRFVAWCAERPAHRGMFPPQVADDRASLWSPLVRQFAEIGRDLFVGGTVAEVLRRLVSVAAEATLGAEIASIALRHRKGSLRTVGCTDESARALDELQERFREGPFHLATRSDGTGMASSANLADESSWPAFGPRAAEKGVRSVLCAGVFPRRGGGVAALSVYSPEPRGLAAANPDVGLVLASYAATALAGTDASTEDELGRARLQEPLRSKDALERAADVLIRRRYLSPEDTYDVLRWASGQLLTSW